MECMVQESRRGPCGDEARHAHQQLRPVLQAALDGHGVALARSVMAHDDVASGRLVRLFPQITFTSALAYYIVHRPECTTLPRLVAFRDCFVHCCFHKGYQVTGLIAAGDNSGAGGNIRPATMAVLGGTWCRCTASSSRRPTRVDFLALQLGYTRQR